MTIKNNETSLNLYVGGEDKEVNEKVGTQLNLKRNSEVEQNIVDIDDLWVKAPEQLNTTPGVYKRQEEENEIDVLWAGLKDTHKHPTPRILYALVGFAAGFVVASAVAAVLFFGTQGLNTSSINPSVLETPAVEQTKKAVAVPVKGSNTVAATNGQYKELKTYTIQSGDTIGALAAHYYGSSDPKYVELIKKANNLKSVHSITAGKKLLIPVYE